jgi:NADPH-dependent curcumin reductase CurA
MTNGGKSVPVTRVNRKWLLEKRPTGRVDEACFRLTEEPVSETLADGEFLVRNLVLSCDPTQRGWMARDTYMPAIPIGDVIRSGAAGRVVASENPAFAVGDHVMGMLGWQDYTKLGPRSPPPSKLPPGVPLETAMSVLGVTGITAYFGLLDVGKPKEGETVVVSGAAGATGSIVGQIARIQGCRAIGIAGGKEKCDWLVQKARFDAAIDYKSEDVAARLGELCPKGIDVYFDNVGGETLDLALVHLAMHGRIVLCGAISTYEDSELRPGPKHYMNLLLKRGRMEGFLVMDYMPRAAEASMQLWSWVRAGQIEFQVDVVRGLENAPRALMRLFSGQNRGKQLVRTAEE